MSRVPFGLINFNNDQVLICVAIAKNYRYKLETPSAEPKICHFMPTNYAPSKISTPDVFSGDPEDQPE
jgi:hypothetical protein